MLRMIRISFLMLGLMTLLTGVAYPLAVTGIASAVFPFRASGSLIERNGRIAGSELIGQQFSGKGWFWGRPSATTPFPYNAEASGGSNLGPTNPVLLDTVKARAVALRQAHPGNKALVPVDLITASGSGLDPDISPEAAAYQVDRVASERALPRDVVAGLVSRHTEGGFLGVLGEPRVNVLKLNLSLEGLRRPNARE